MIQQAVKMLRLIISYFSIPCTLILVTAQPLPPDCQIQRLNGQNLGGLKRLWLGFAIQAERGEQLLILIGDQG